MCESPTSASWPGPDAQDDKPGRSLVIVNETTNILMWLLPSPARARRACPLPGQTGRGIREGNAPRLGFLGGSRHSAKRVGCGSRCNAVVRRSHESAARRNTCDRTGADYRRTILRTSAWALWRRSDQGRTARHRRISAPAPAGSRRGEFELDDVQPGQEIDNAQLEASARARTRDAPA